MRWGYANENVAVTKENKAEEGDPLSVVWVLYIYY